MSEVVCMRLPGILNTYDPAYGVPLMAHIVTNLKWYLYKWVKASSKHQERFTQLSDEVEAGMIAECPLQERMDVAEVVALIFLNLDEYDKTIILLKISDEQSITELADTFGISRGSAHGHLKAALTRARVIAERLVEHQA